jgi:hypothetical protein
MKIEPVHAEIADWGRFIDALPAGTVFNAESKVNSRLCEFRVLVDGVFHRTTAGVRTQNYIHRSAAGAIQGTACRHICIGIADGYTIDSFAQCEVLHGNIGMIHRGLSVAKAHDAYLRAVIDSAQNYGRGGNENVTLLIANDIALEYRAEDASPPFKEIPGHTTTTRGSRYEVVVGNVGTITETTDFAHAITTYRKYLVMSIGGYGRVSNEQVTLLIDGEPELEYHPPGDDDAEDG